METRARHSAATEQTFQLWPPLPRLCLIWPPPSRHCLLPPQPAVRSRPVSQRPAGEKSHPCTLCSNEPLSPLSSRISRGKKAGRGPGFSGLGWSLPYLRESQASGSWPWGSLRSFGGSVGLSLASSVPPPHPAYSGGTCCARCSLDCGRGPTPRQQHRVVHPRWALSAERRRGNQTHCWHLMCRQDPLLPGSQPAPTTRLQLSHPVLMAAEPLRSCEAGGDGLRGYCLLLQ